MESPDLHVTLASTLLDLEHEQEDHRSTFLVGVSSIDDTLRDSPWMGGKVVGTGHLQRDGSKEDAFATKHLSEDRDLVHKLVTTHLLHLGQTAAAFFHSNWKIREDIRGPSVFMVVPPNSSSTSSVYETVHRLIERSQLADSKHRERHTRSPPPPANTTKAFPKWEEWEERHKKQPPPPPTPSSPEVMTLTLLDRVNLIQYLDLTGLAESLSEASRLIRTSGRTDVAQQQEQSDQPNKSPYPKLLVIEGITQTLAQATTRSPSALAQNAALLTNILRSLRQLVREHLELLVLVDFNVYLDLPDKASVRHGETDSDMGSAFADSKGRILRIKIGSTSAGFGVGSIGGQRSGGSGRAANLVLGRILENALDTVVVTHEPREETEDRCIVEVVKDVDGACTGYWTVWQHE